MQKIFLGIALFASVAGALLAQKTLLSIDKNLAQAKENARPANLKLVKITTPNCLDCFDLDQAVGILKKQNIAVGEEKVVVFDTPEAQALIVSLGIKRLPAYIATGEISKNSLAGFIKDNGEIKNETFVFTKVTPIFIDSESKKEVGRVTVTYLFDPTCAKCFDPKLTVEAFIKAGVKITEQKELIFNSRAGQKIISQYQIVKIPTFFLSSDIDLYDDVKANWPNFGTVEADKTYVARSLPLPYRDLKKGQILGLVDVIYLADSSCNDCYKPPEVHRNILTSGFGIGLQSERTVDIASLEGKNLVNQYKITKVPTLLLSPAADLYANLKSVWKNVGSVESNGWYVFREMAQIGNVTYKDLAADQVIRPTTPASGQTPK